MQGKLLEKDKIVADLEVEKKMLDEKVKVKIKRDILEAAIEDMRIELC